MRKLAVSFFACVMMLSIVFVGDAIASSESMAANAAMAQTRSRRRKPGITRRTYRGGKRVAHTTKRGTKKAGRKSWRTGRKVVSRTKKIIY